MTEEDGATIDLFRYRFWELVTSEVVSPASEGDCFGDRAYVLAAVALNDVLVDVMQEAGKSLDEAIDQLKVGWAHHTEGRRRETAAYQALKRRLMAEIRHLRVVE